MEDTVLNFIYAIFAFLIARAIWDFAKRRARAMKISPLNWLLRVTFGFAFLGLVGYALVLTIAYCVMHQ